MVYYLFCGTLCSLSRLAQMAEHRSYEPKATGSKPVPRNPYGAMDNAFDF